MQCISASEQFIDAGSSTDLVHTPINRVYLANSLRDSNLCTQTPFGCDFLKVGIQGRQADFKFDLLRHLAILEGRKKNLFELPIKDEDVLELLRSATTEPDHGGLDVDDLIKSLQACLDTSSESGGCWLQQATRKTKKDICEAKGIVE